MIITFFIFTVSNRVNSCDQNCEELLLSENSLEEIPSTLEKLSNLKILKLTNNKLRTIPFGLADLLTLEVLDCGNNPHLSIIPRAWQSDTDSVLFVCRVHRGKNRRY